MLNALYLVLGGMAIVFAALAIVLVVMFTLGKLFRPKTEDGAEGGK